MCRLDTFMSIIADRIVSDFNSACSTSFYGSLITNSYWLYFVEAALLIIIILLFAVLILLVFQCFLVICKNKILVDAPLLKDQEDLKTQNRIDYVKSTLKIDLTIPVIKLVFKRRKYLTFLINLILKE